MAHSHSHVDHHGGVRGIVNQADVDSGKVKIVQGDRGQVAEFVGLLDTFPFWFNIVTP